MKNVGTYCNGDPFLVNPVAGTGVNFTSITPASANSAGRQINGAMINFGEGWSGYFPVPTQGFDSIEPGISTPWSVYNAPENIDPGKTASPLNFEPGTEGTILKCVSKAAPEAGANRDRIDFVGLMTVVAVAPPANAFRPGVCCPSKVSKWLEDDMDLSSLRNLTLPASAPSVDSVLATQRWPIQAWVCDNASGRSVCGNLNHRQYGSDLAQQLGNSLLLMNGNIGSPNKLLLAKAGVQRGIDVFERVKAGGNFNNGGGGHSAHKGYLVFAAHLLGDAEMLDWCDRSLHKVFVEDNQYELVTSTDVASHGYPADALDGPEWFILGHNNAGEDSAEDAIYRDVNFRWQPGVGLGFSLMGARAAWKNNIFFDYIDRIMNRRFFKTSGTTALAANASSSNAPTQFHKDMWAAHRTAAGMPAIWNW